MSEQNVIEGEVIPATEQAVEPAKQAMDIEHRVGQYVMLRDEIKARDDAHKLAMKPYRETLEALNALMLDHLGNIGGDSVKTSNGTVYKTMKKTASIQDGDAFMRHVIGSEAWELLDKKANVAAVEDFIKENGVLPPGVKWSTVAVVGVRRS